MRALKRIEFSAAFLCLLVFISIFADFLSSNNPSTQRLNQFFIPPSPIHLFEGNGRFSGKPFIYKTELIDPLDVEYKENEETVYPLEFFYKGTERKTQC